VKLEPGQARMRYVDRDQPRAAAIRSSMALMTSLVYSVVPFAPVTTSWLTFAAWTCGLAVYWDLHFTIVHSIAHENRHAYKWLHKLHHIYKAPDCFGAYFVTYQSHFFTEQLVILIAATAGLPVDVFTWTLGFGTLDTFIKHAGHDLSSQPLPLLPISWEQLSTLLSPWGLVLGGHTTAMHDWHHEKFTTNYSLSFTYLDKLLGTYHPGRRAGEAIKVVQEVKKAEEPSSVHKGTLVDDDGNPLSVEETPTQEASIIELSAGPKMKRTATYTNLIDSTKEDWLLQGAAFDKYKADGHIVRNVLRLVEVMKGELGEIGTRVDMYEHSLQTATRARRAGADTETIVCALLHDIGKILSGTTNAGEIAASVLRPYITPLNHWMLSSHEIFAAFYFLDKCGGDKDLRDKVQEYTSQGYVKGHPYYDATEKFCLEYSQPSYDPTYDTDSMASFIPLVEEIFGREPFWWEPQGKPVDQLDCKARLALGYSLDARAD